MVFLTMLKFGDESLNKGVEEKASSINPKRFMYGLFVFLIREWPHTVIPSLLPNVYHTIRPFFILSLPSVPRHARKSNNAEHCIKRCWCIWNALIRI